MQQDRPTHARPELSLSSLWVSSRSPVSSLSTLPPPHFLFLPPIQEVGGSGGAVEAADVFHLTPGGPSLACLCSLGWWWQQLQTTKVFFPIQLLVSSRESEKQEEACAHYPLGATSLG